MASDLHVDEVGRCFCKAHMRAKCHECCYDFIMMNEMAEEQAGLRKPKSRVEELCAQRVMTLRGLDFIRRNGDETFKSDNEEGLREAEEGLAELLSQGETTQEDVAKWTQKAIEQYQAQECDMRAVYAAWKEENPGAGPVMEWGGAETQRLYDRVAAKPPSAASDRADKRSCSWCGATSGAQKLRVCAQCKGAYYCNVDCQRAAWKGHKQECKPQAAPPPSPAAKKKKDKLPLTWEQLEAYGCERAHGQILELRAVENQSITRPVFACKDRVGTIRRIANYTSGSNNALAGLKVGSVLRWKHPRFHYFLDGSSGARLEDDDLLNIDVVAS
mmetsp:Transcript_30533/g.93323  ORF Transcript_30533/g.93323 Transcript_30533/m.93323 type:complete len:330 (+) Transcript_30533:80-1069(+)